ncbi:unnamed protein product [Tenebrio molitor]|nr:unnamed protein product [Tenebrio molitor]
MQNKMFGQPKSLIQMLYGRYFTALKLIKHSFLRCKTPLPYCNVNNYSSASLTLTKLTEAEK